MRRNTRTVLTAALLGTTALVGVTACGDAGGDDARATVGKNTQTAGTTGPATSMSGPTSGATATSSGRMTEGLNQPVVLVRGGGIGGVRDRVEVRPDGTMTVQTKGGSTVTRQLSEAQLASVVRALQQASLPSLAKAPTTGAHSDELTYTITAEGMTYTTTESQAPAEVKPLLDALGALLNAPAPTP